MTPKDIEMVKEALETTEHPMLMSMLYLGKKDAFEAVKIVNKAARAYVETALSSPPAIDLEGLKREIDTALSKEFSTLQIRRAANAVIDHIAATGRLKAMEKMEESDDL